ncbi:MAG: dienelactone hydrolase family protein [Gammaproteobacteria bacterium]|nr:MAG: dienelactone hydrolase family protein [Gammaproteobacteria bacterium]
MMTHLMDFLPAVEIETDDSPTHAIIWLHGLGADGNDFVPIVDELEFSPGTAVRFVFPHAPERPVTINNGYIMRAWYDIVHANFSDHQDKSGIHGSQKAIDALIDREMQRGIPSERIVLAGFSQGGAMALQAGLRQHNPLAGIIALSCYLPLADTLSAEASSANAATPIFMAHGSYDPVVPLTLAIQSKEKLLASGYSLEWHEFPMAHTVCGQEIAAISSWLRRILG